MKRLLFENIKVMPYANGQVTDRLGVLSGVLGINVTAVDDSAAAVVAVTHCDTRDGTFEPVKDDGIFLGETVVERDPTGKIIQCSASVPVTAGQLINVDIDLLGCKQYIKVNVTYVAKAVTVSATAEYAIVLGDCHEAPTEA